MNASDPRDQGEGGDDDKEASRKLIANERAKMSATYLNGLAIAVFAVGGLTVPFASLQGGGPTTPVIVLAIVCSIVSLILHYGARSLLRDLRA